MLPPTPRHWFRFLDDTFVIQWWDQRQLFLENINNIDHAGKFAVEGNQESGTFPFLDTLVEPEVDGSLSISVCGKPTHAEQYLQWDGHCSLAAKYGVTGALAQRAGAVCTGPELLDKKIQHLREALFVCGYLRWALDKVQGGFLNSSWEEGDAQGAPHIKGIATLVVSTLKGLP